MGGSIACTLQICVPAASAMSWHADTCVPSSSRGHRKVSRNRMSSRHKPDSAFSNRSFSPRTPYGWQDETSVLGSSRQRPDSGIRDWSFSLPVGFFWHAEAGVLRSSMHRVESGIEDQPSSPRGALAWNAETGVPGRYRRQPDSRPCYLNDNLVGKTAMSPLSATSWGQRRGHAKLLP